MESSVYTCNQDIIWVLTGATAEIMSKDRYFGVLQSQRSEMQKVSNEAEEEPRLWCPESQIKTLFHRGRDRLFQISPRDPIN